MGNACTCSAACGASDADAPLSYAGAAAQPVGWFSRQRGSAGEDNFQIRVADHLPHRGELVAESSMGNPPRELNLHGAIRRTVGLKVLSNQGTDVYGCVYGDLPATIGGRVLGIIAGRAGMFLDTRPRVLLPEIHLSEDGGRDLVAALSSRTPIPGLTYNACPESTVSPFLPNDPSAIEIFAGQLTQGFTTDWRRRSALARKVLGFEPGVRENLPPGTEGCLWSLLLASGDALGGLYPDLCVIALMDCTRLTFVEEGVSSPSAGLLSVEFLLATLSALTTRAGGRRVSLTTSCYCSALIQRYACASLAPAHLEFNYVVGQTSMSTQSGSGALFLFWKVASFIFKMPVSWTYSTREMHTLGPVCHSESTLPQVDFSWETTGWSQQGTRVGALQDTPVLLDLERLRKLVARVVSAEVAIFGDGARVLFDAMVPSVPDVAPVPPTIPRNSPPVAGLECPYESRDLGRRLGEGAGLAGWDATQRATWVVLNWDMLASGPWTSAGLEAMSFLLRFDTSCPLQVEYARWFGSETDGVVQDALDSLDPQPWLTILDDTATAGLRGLVCLLVDAERSQDVWANSRVPRGRCYGPVASNTSCGAFTSLDPRGSPIVYGLRVLQGSDPASVDYGEGISGFMYHSRPGQVSWCINFERTRGFGRTLHIKHRPSVEGSVVSCPPKTWNRRTNGLVGSTKHPN